MFQNVESFSMTGMPPLNKSTLLVLPQNITDFQKTLKAMRSKENHFALACTLEPFIHFQCVHHKHRQCQLQPEDSFRLPPTLLVLTCVRAAASLLMLGLVV